MDLLEEQELEIDQTGQGPVRGGQYLGPDYNGQSMAGNGTFGQKGYHLECLKQYLRENNKKKTMDQSNKVYTVYVVLYIIM